MRQSSDRHQLRERMLAEQVMSIRAASPEDRAAHEALAALYLHRLRRTGWA